MRNAYLKFNPYTGDSLSAKTWTAEDYPNNLWRYNPWTGVKRPEIAIEGDPRGMDINQPALGVWIPRVKGEAHPNKGTVQWVNSDGDEGGPCGVRELGWDSHYHVCRYMMVEADADGWILHDGGPCPVPKETLIDVKYRNGYKRTNVPALVSQPGPDATSESWEDDGSPYDIVAYQVCQAQTSNLDKAFVDLAKALVSGDLEQKGDEFEGEPELDAPFILIHDGKILAGTQDEETAKALVELIRAAGGTVSLYKCTEV